MGIAEHAFRHSEQTRGTKRAPLKLELWPMPILGNDFLVKINGHEAYKGLVPASSVSFSAPISSQATRILSLS